MSILINGMSILINGMSIHKLINGMSIHMYELIYYIKPFEHTLLYN